MCPATPSLAGSRGTQLPTMMQHSMRPAAMPRCFAPLQPASRRRRQLAAGPPSQQQRAEQRHARGTRRHSSSSGGGGSGGGRADVDMDAVMYSDEVPLSKLQQLLDDAVDAEDYGVAAQLRDVLQRRRFDSRLAVEEANERFYAAFQKGSLAEMSGVWGKGEHVQCIHPLCGCIAGRQAVMESWKAILGAGRMRIALEDVRVFASDSQAFVTCVEVNESSEGKGRIAATNIFEKQGGVWKLVHHHGSPMRSGGF